MKIVNKIMMGIAVLCLLLCGGVLVFALNPDMSSSLAQRLYGNANGAETGTEETATAATEENGAGSNLVGDVSGGNISVTLPTEVPAGSAAEPDGTAQATADATEENDPLSGYINTDPQEPLRYPSGSTGSTSGMTTATPAPRSDALTDLSSYYADCKKQLTALGSGDQHFDNVVSKSLWNSIEQIYDNGAYEQGYVNDVLKNLGMQNFAIQLQLEDLGDGYYRVYHNVVTY